MKSKIVFDTDCLCSFLWTDSVYLLLKLYSGRIVIPDVVQNEIAKIRRTEYRFVYDRLKEYLSVGDFESFNIMTGDNATYNEYIRLISHPYQIGRGEAATIAIAKTVKGYTASNNLRDIRKFIDLGEIENITTIDILCEAYTMGIKTIAELEKLKNDMIARGRRLPPQTIEEILKNKGLIS